MTPSESWEFSDAWVYLAIEMAGEGRKPRPLHDVIHAADYINKAIVAYAELDGALRRLTSAGLVVKDDVGVAPTSLEIVRPQPSDSMYDRLDRIRADLAKRPSPNPASGTGLSPNEYDTALAQYQAWWQEQPRARDPGPSELLAYAAQYVGWYIDSAFKGDPPSDVEPLAWLDAAAKCTRRAHDAVAATVTHPAGPKE
jgi:hypothetical protein